MTWLRNNGIAAVLIVLTMLALAWAAHTGAMRECRAAQASGAWQGDC